MQRRSFLQKLILAAATFGAASVPYGIYRLLTSSESTAFSNHLRPPGALSDEAAFISACIGCGMCGEICPPNAFSLIKGEEAGITRPI